MKNNMKRVLGGAVGAAVLLSGGAQVIAATAAPQAMAVTATDTHYTVKVEEEKAPFDAVAKVKGDFTYNQSVVSPDDDYFNLFGTALTGICAAPSYVFEKGEGVTSHYINVGGNIKKAYSIDLRDVQEKEQTRLMMCSCATSSATAAVKVTGVTLKDILSFAEMEEGVNTLTMYGSDGYGIAMPLSYVLEKEAVLGYAVNGRNLPSGTQVFIPETVAKYFTRDVVKLELTKEENVSTVDGRDAEFRSAVNILNTTEGVLFQVGDRIEFEGYADDCGKAITAIEFSMDGGKTWTTKKTKTNANLWVNWKFAYKAEAAGNYQLSVRAVSEDGTVSPLSSTISFTVVE